MIPGVGRRALAGVLGLGMAVPAAMAAPSGQLTAEDRLAVCLSRLWATDDYIAALPDDDGPLVGLALDRMDELLSEAARVRPDTDKGFAMKARIAQLYAPDARAGDMVLRYLLADLMARGGLGA